MSFVFNFVFVYIYTECSLKQIICIRMPSTNTMPLFTHSLLFADPGNMSLIHAIFFIFFDASYNACDQVCNLSFILYFRPFI